MVVVVVVSDLWRKTVGRIAMIIFLSFPKPYTKMEKTRGEATAIPFWKGEAHGCVGMDLSVQRKLSPEPAMSEMKKN